MVDKNTPMTEGEKYVEECEKIRYQTMLSSLHKFRLFFAGLVFAILSFAIQYPIKSNYVLIKILESASWILFAITGYFALKDLGGFHSLYTEKALEGIGGKKRKWMWCIFLAGIIALMLSKITDSFFKV